jgi:hypothetical protein
MAKIKTLEEVLEQLGKFKQEFDRNPALFRALSSELEQIPNNDVVKETATIRCLFSLYDVLKSEGVVGKQVLDLGCGSRVQTSYDNDEPWLARILQAYGTDVVGLDIRDSSNEVYEHIQADLTGERLDQILDERSFDFVIAKDFFTSPTLLNDPNSTLSDYNTRQLEEFFRDISMQVFNILNTGGIYIPEFVGIKEEEILRGVGFRVEPSRYSRGTEPTILARKPEYIKME